MIEAEKALRDYNLENTRYDSGSTLGRVALTSGIINPLIDSAVVNASAKDYGMTFKGALKTGIFDNYTMMGGNGLGGSSAIDKLPFIGKRLEKWKNNKPSGSRGIFGDKYTINYLSEAGQKSMGITDDTIKAVGIGNADHVIETGWGISRNNSGVFNALKKQEIGTSEVRYIDEDAVSSVTKEIIDHKKNSSQWMSDTINTAEKFNKKGKKGNVAKKGKLARKIQENIDKPMADLVDKYREVSTNGKVLNLDTVLKNGNEDETIAFFAGHLKNKGAYAVQEVQEGLSKAGVDVGVKIDANSVVRGNKISQLFSLGNNKNIKRFVNNLGADEYSKLASELGVASGGKINFTKETVEAIKNSAFVKNITGAAASNLDEAATATATALHGRYIAKTGFEKVMSNKFVQIATGNVVSGALSFGVNIGGAVIGGMANSHSESAIQSIANASVFSPIRGEEVYSEEGTSATYGHARLAQSNDEDMMYVLSSDNIANRYRQDIDPVDIDYTLGRLENFTTY